MLLDKFDFLSDVLHGTGMSMQINSVYRNPARSDGQSRHQYGDAVDLQVFDFNKDGATDTKD